MDLTQTGADVTGTVHVSGPAVNQPTTVQGTVVGNEFRLAGRISGTFVVTADQMTGNVNGMFPATATLTRQK
jgi:cytoskeletal protein CcmA (bactofilin family)